MNNLSNANLLDEHVGGNLKNERLQKTAQTAQNPNMEKPTQETQPQMQQPIPQMQMPNPQNIERQMQSNADSNSKDDENIPNNLPIRDYSKKKSSDSDDNKILGMKPALFYGILGVTLLVGGYFGYKYFTKKGKGSKSLDTGGASTGSTTASATPKIVEVPIT